jgi:uroporphyrin-3 C-methyltransferase
MSAPHPDIPADTQPSRWKSHLQRPALWLIVLACGLAALWGDTRSQVATLQQDFARRLADSDDQAKQDRVLLKQSQQQVAELQVKAGVLEAKLAETQSQALALESMYQELSSSRDERLLAEVEQALSIAMQQLQFAGNVETALLALQSADARLARANQPRFLQLRKLLAHDIERLKASSAADITGLSIKLESVIAGIDRLPLAFEQRPKLVEAPPPVVEEKSAWRGLMTDLWQEFRQLLRIERINHSDPALLAPQQSLYLRENLKLRLLNARLALLQRDGQTFRSELQQSRETLERYFDSSARPVQAADATLRQLAATDISASLPRLVESLAALRTLKPGK